MAYWSIGDSYDYKITKTTQQWKEGKPSKDERQEYTANFSVIDSTADSYIINWTFENSLMNTYEISQELTERFSKYKLTVIKYKTSAMGDFPEVINWKEVGEIMNSMFVDLAEVLGEKDENERKAIQKSLQPFKEIYSSKEGVEQLVLKELHYFHFPMGLEYDPSETIEYDDEIPNMFGGDPIKAKAKIYIDSVDVEDSFCVVRQELSLDPEGTRVLLKQVFKEMKLADKDFNKALKTAIFEINDKNTFEYFYDPGIPHRIEAVRESRVEIGQDKGKRVDNTVIELIYSE